MKQFTTILLLLLFNFQSFGQENGKFSSLEEALKQKENVIYLDLQNQNLTNIPNQITEFKNLKTLDLSFNKISKIDVNTKFPNSLEILLLSNNLLTEFNLIYLENLMSLSLSNNNLKSINENIGKFSKLFQLRLDGNKLEEIPNSICNLKNLYWLHIDYNQLKTLPKNIGKLKTLQALIASNNNLTFIPISILKLKNLTALELASNKITKVPDKLLYTNLENINLSSNKIENLENLIPNLNSKVVINLMYNPLNIESETVRIEHPNVTFIIDYNDFRRSNIIMEQQSE